MTPFDGSRQMAALLARGESPTGAASRRPGSLNAMKTVIFVALSILALPAAAEERRVRLIVETDAGGDPDDEQSLVRLLVYASDFDLEGIIANRPRARDGENLNPVRTGLGIVQAHVKAYGECYENLVR